MWMSLGLTNFIQHFIIFFRCVIFTLQQAEIYFKKKSVEDRDTMLFSLSEWVNKNFLKRNVFPELEIIVMVLKIKNVLLVVYFAVSRDTNSCKLLRSTRVSASFFLRAFSSLSSLLCVFSASRCSLVKLFTAGKKLHRRLKKTKRLLRMRAENSLQICHHNKPGQRRVFHTQHHCIVH